MLVFTKRQRAMLEIQRRRNDRATYTTPLRMTMPHPYPVAEDDDEEEEDEDEGDFFHEFATNILPYDHIFQDELQKYEIVRTYYQELVESSELVSSKDFWQRYFYRTYSLERVVRELSTTRTTAATGSQNHTNRNPHSPMSRESTSIALPTTSHQNQSDNNKLISRRLDSEQSSPHLEEETLQFLQRPDKEHMIKRIHASAPPQRRPRESLGPLSLFSFVLPQMSQIVSHAPPDLMPATSTMEESSSYGAAAAVAVSSSTNFHDSTTEYDTTTPTTTPSYDQQEGWTADHNNNESVVQQTQGDGEDADDDDSIHEEDDDVTTTTVEDLKPRPMTTLFGGFFCDHHHHAYQQRRAKSFGALVTKKHQHHRTRASFSPSAFYDGNTTTTASPIKTIVVVKTNPGNDKGEPSLDDDDFDNTETSPSAIDDKPVISPPSFESISLLPLLISLVFLTLAQINIGDFVDLTSYYNGLCAPYIPSVYLPRRSFVVEAPWWAPGWRDGFRTVCGPERIQTRLEWEEYATGKFRLLVQTVNNNNNHGNGGSTTATNTSTGRQQPHKKKIKKNNTLFFGKKLQTARIMANEIILQTTNGKVQTVPAPWTLE